MYDVKPGWERVPELAEHIAKRRQETLEAIRRGLVPERTADTVAVPNRLADRLAAQVLASLEQYWRDCETFS